MLVGQNVVFECKFQSEPKPTVTWYHVDQNGARTQITTGVIEIPGGTQLELPAVGNKDKGEYTCVANNGLETVSQHAFLVTQGAYLRFLLHLLRLVTWGIFFCFLLLLIFLSDTKL